MSIQLIPGLFRYANNGDIKVPAGRLQQHAKVHA